LLKSLFGDFGLFKKSLLKNVNDFDLKSVFRTFGRSFKYINNIMVKNQNQNPGTWFSTFQNSDFDLNHFSNP
jgi:hypothetical protein